MSFLFSSDNRYFKVTSDATPMLTPSGVDDYYAAVKIQRWWRKSKETIVFSGESYRPYSDTSSSSRERSTTSEDSMYVNSYLRKRKFENDTESQVSVEPQSSSESNTNRDYDSTDNESDMDVGVEDETRLVNHNNFLYDFFNSFLSFFMRLFGLN
jgi:hypothetical protein